MNGYAPMQETPTRPTGPSGFPVLPIAIGCRRPYSRQLPPLMRSSVPLAL